MTTVVAELRYADDVSERTDTKRETAEERRDKLAEAVWEADRAWYTDIENATLKSDYVAAKTLLREFENDAIARGASETCQRCGGAGGWKGWPGFTCFNCGGPGRVPMRKTKFQAAPNTRRKKEAKIDAEISKKDAAYERAIGELGDVGIAIDAAREQRRAEHEWYEGNYDDPPGGAMNREELFRADIADKLWKYGSLSEAQIEAVRKGVEREAEREAELDAAGPLPEGTYEMTGEIVSTRWQESQYGTTQKMLVKLDTGNKIWGTVPKSLTGQNDPGTRVTFSATVTRSDDDEHFGFFSRPKQARVAEERLV